MPGFSPPAITALVEATTGGSSGSSSPSPAKYRSGPQIEMFLGNCGIDLTIGSQSRVPALRDALTAINRTPNAVERLKPLFEAVVNPADYASERDEPKHAPLVEYMNRALRADGYELVESGGRFRLLAVGAVSPAAEAVRDAADILDLDTVRHHLDDALALVASRPDGAIRAACSTVESVCSTILTRLGVTLPADRSITPLYREVARQLDLSPDRPDLTQDLRQILGGLAGTVGGIGALRTHAGDAHGQPAGTPRPDARLARLAVHAASAVCEFLIETWRPHHRS